ncbi:MAG TPA: DUF559 domain-containing protein [Parvularculaceae bacterium]|nr:DUF559 domain-containing protein [Parvularculaceae bacterium]
MKPTVEKARTLRRNQTNAETIFWRRVRNRGLGALKFKRQVPIGPYVADFMIDEARLIIELDGDQHGIDKGRAHDAARDAYLRREGYEVLRIWNREVYDRIVDVLDHVLYVAQMRIADIESEKPSPETASPFRR